MPQSKIELYTELSDMLQYRDEQPVKFSQQCNLLDRCLRFCGLLSVDAPAVDRTFIIKMLDNKKFCSFCYSPDTQHLRCFVYGRVLLHGCNILLGVDHVVCSTSNVVEQMRANAQIVTMRRLIYKFALAHYGEFSLEPDAEVLRTKVFWIYGTEEQRKVVRLKPR